VTERISLESIGSHVVHLPVRVGDRAESRFIFDTGIGLDLVTSPLLDRCGGQRTGETYVGRRMSGQSISVPLARIPSLSVGSLRREGVEVGVFDPGLPPEWSRIEGFLSPRFFAPTPFTVRRRSGALTVEPDLPPVEAARGEREVPMEVRWDGPSVSLFTSLVLPDGSTGSVEVDTGSGNLILDLRFMRALGVPTEGEGVTKTEGTDETGHTYARYFGRVRGRVELREAPSVAQTDPDVMFQKIIYDGLLGDDFLGRYDVTYDLGRSRLRFAAPSP
jgi:hypothetical protein